MLLTSSGSAASILLIMSAIAAEACARTTLESEELNGLSGVVVLPYDLLFFALGSVLMTSLLPERHGVPSVSGAPYALPA